MAQEARNIYQEFLSSQALSPVNIDRQAWLGEEVLAEPRPDMFRAQQLQVSDPRGRGQGRSLGGEDWVGGGQIWLTVQADAAAGRGQRAVPEAAGKGLWAEPIWGPGGTETRGGPWVPGAGCEYSDLVLSRSPFRPTSLRSST